MKINKWIVAVMALPLIMLDFIALSGIFQLMSYPNTLIVLFGLFLLSILSLTNYLLITKIKIK